jgi:hypothetical protein
VIDRVQPPAKEQFIDWSTAVAEGEFNNVAEEVAHY